MLTVFSALAACGGGVDRVNTAPANAGNAPGNVPVAPERPAHPPVPRSDIPKVVLAARDIIFIRESMELPEQLDPEARSRDMLHLEAGIAAGFKKHEAELARTAAALGPNVPRTEQYRILVALVDELTGWDKPGVTPWGEIEE